MQLRTIDSQSNSIETELVDFFRLYNAGAQPKIQKLFHPVKFPVAKGTPMIQSMVEWDHSTSWSVADYSSAVSHRIHFTRSNMISFLLFLALQGSKTGESIIEVDTAKEEQAFYVGHTIDGRVLFPATGYLVSE